jgi:hypothetical protein
MTDGVNVDWSLLKSPDYVGDYANAFLVGRQMACGPTPAVPPEVNALNPGAGPSPTPDPWGARLDALSGPDRARAASQAEILVNLGTGLRAYPYGERARILRHLAPALAARGVPGQALADFDPTDQTLDATVGAARALQARLAAPPAGSAGA